MGAASYCPSTPQWLFSPRVTVEDLWFATKRETEPLGTSWELSAGAWAVAGRTCLEYTPRCRTTWSGLERRQPRQGSLMCMWKTRHALCRSLAGLLYSCISWCSNPVIKRGMVPKSSVLFSAWNQEQGGLELWGMILGTFVSPELVVQIEEDAGQAWGPLRSFKWNWKAGGILSKGWESLLKEVILGLVRKWVNTDQESSLVKPNHPTTLRKTSATQPQAVWQSCMDHTDQKLPTSDIGRIYDTWIGL